MDRFERALIASLDFYAENINELLKSGTVSSLEQLQYLNGQLYAIQATKDALPEVRKKADPSYRDEKEGL